MAKSPSGSPKVDTGTQHLGRVVGSRPMQRGLDAQGRGDLPKPLAHRVGVPRGLAEPVGGEDEPALIELATGREGLLAAVFLIVGEQLERTGIERQAALAVGL